MKRQNADCIVLKRQILVLVFLLLVPVFITGSEQQIRFRRISLEEGLPQTTINFIMQDKKGFMWFGTQEGLCRYDGYEFKVYKQNPKNENAISDSYVWTIYPDNDGFIWVGTNNGGLDRFDPKTEIFRHYPYVEGSDDSLSNNCVTSIFKDSNGNLWIGTREGGLNLLIDKEEKRFKRFELKIGKDVYNHVTCICQDSNGILWIGTKGGGLFYLDNDQPTHWDAERELNHDTVNCIYEDSFKALWVGANEGRVYRLDRNDMKFVLLKIEMENESAGNKEDNKGKSSILDINVKVIFEDRDKNFWLGIEGAGLILFNRGTDKIECIYKNNPALNTSLSGNTVNAIFEDITGVLWVSTRGTGLNIVSPMFKKFLLYRNDEIHQGISINDNNIRCIYKDKQGVIWFGTLHGGLNRYDPKAIEPNKYTYFNKHNTTLSNNMIYSIFEDSEKILWVGTRGGGLFQFDREEEKFSKHYQFQKEKLSTLSENIVRVIYETEDHTLWIGTEGGGLNRYNRGNDVFDRLNKPNKENRLSSNNVFCMLEDDSGTLWVGTRNGGLNKMIDREEGRFTTYKTPTLSHNFVLCIFEDSRNDLWIGTYGGGLNKMINRERGTFRVFRVKDGLPNDTIYGILEDEKHNLWLSTNKGISRFNPVKKSFVNYDVGDGLQSNEFNSGAYFKDKNGRMFFGGINGVTAFFPGELKTDKNKTIPGPGVVITNFLFKNKPVPLQHQDKTSPLAMAIHEIDETQTLTLPYEQNYFTLEFSALDYRNPEAVQYQYKLEGVDGIEIHTDAKNRRATYTNLSPGIYTFKVKARNPRGGWDEKKAASLKIEILPPWWWTWWAKIIYDMLAFVFIYFAWLSWSRHILKKRVKEQTSQLIQAEKMASLGTLVSGVAHEINNPATSTHTSAFTLNRDLEKFKTYLVETDGNVEDEKYLKELEEKFANLFAQVRIVRDGTDRIKNIVQNLRTFSRMEIGVRKQIDLHQGLKATLALVKAEFKEKVEFVVDIPGKLEIEGNPGELNQVFMNIIANACDAILEKRKQYGDQTEHKLFIQTRKEEEFAIIEFRDTGMGMPEKVKAKMFEPFFTTKPEGKGMGLGLALSFRIIKDHQGRIKVDSRVGEGTRIIISLPCRSNKLEEERIETYATIR